MVKIGLGWRGVGSKNQKWDIIYVRSLTFFKLKLKKTEFKTDIKKKKKKKKKNEMIGLS